MGVVYGLYRLGLASEGARDNFGRAFKMLRQRDSEEKLQPGQQRLMREIQQRLAKLRR